MVEGIDAEVKKQVEYYLSDDNLERDSFFHDKIKNSKDGYLSLDYIMKCKKIKELKVTKKCIISAIANSSELETAADQKSIRRIGQKPLPALKAVAKRKTPEESKTTQKADPNVITEDDLVGVVVLKIEIEGKTEITCGWRDIERRFKEEYSSLKTMYSRFKDAIGQLVISSHLDKIDDILKKVYDTPLKVDKDTFKITKLDEKELAEFNEQHGSHMNMCIRKKISLQKKFKQKEVRAAKAAKVEKEEKKLADIELGGTKFNDINKIKSKF